MNEKRVAVSAVAVSAGMAAGKNMTESLSRLPKNKPNSFYKQKEIKRLAKQFMKSGATKVRARELAKIWHQMSPEQKAEVMREKA